MSGTPFPAIYDAPSYALTNLTATGTNQATAFGLAAAVNVFANVPPGSGCILPAAAAKLTIVNDGTNALNIYPNLGDQISGLAVNEAYSLAAGAQITFATTAPPLSPPPRVWQQIGEDLSSGGTINGDLTVEGTFQPTVIQRGISIALQIQTDGGFVLGSAQVSVAATGTAYAGAAQLSNQINNVTTSTAGSGVILPSSLRVLGSDSATTSILVLNNGTAAITVYGAHLFLGQYDTIDGTAGTTGVTLTNGHRCFFTPLSTGVYVSGPEGGVTS